MESISSYISCYATEQPASQSASLLHRFEVNAVMLEPAPPAAQLISRVPKLLTSSCLLSLPAFSVVSGKSGCLRGADGGVNSPEGVHLVPLSDQFLPVSSFCHTATVAFYLSASVWASEIFLSCRYFVWLQNIFLMVTGDLVIPQSPQ